MNKKRFLYIPLGLALSFYGCNQATQETEKVTEQLATTQAAPQAKKQAKTKTIVFFGNSLTAGLGLEPDQAFPALIQQRLDSLNLPYNVVNAGVSGETSAGGKSRIYWLLKQPIDVFVLELGANDGLRGIDPASTYLNLGEIVDKVRAKNPDVKILLAGMQLPPSMGQKYTTAFKNVFTRLSEEKDLILIPFLLEGVGGVPKLNQKDGIHPTEEGQKILANNVWEHLEEVVSEPAGEL
ncbi:arylesterase [Pontibacter arcticus]|uniref:Arylesterase n=1 Tax=Pontibacter arcticus TaxID=2080288 RepID=A0A364RG12_9BACT|nr:arylesterase [Pontibacter arcticus]RAU83223.1 arylesterase [Pontibacter arcticus]